MSSWTISNIPDQEGKLFIITGANSGLGFESTKALAEKKAKVVMACRNLEKGLRSQHEIRNVIPGEDLDLRELDLADLSSINRFVTGIQSDYKNVDVLINNAGIMATPYGKTTDGFEQQLGTNHLGHFALTGKLLKLLLKSPGSRIVNVSSIAARRGKIYFNDLQAVYSYKPWDRYQQSKLANLLFTFELKRRIDAHNLNLKIMAAHPGVSATNLHKGMYINQRLISTYDILMKWLLPDAAKGALSILYSATDPHARSGGYYGPGGLFELAGLPSEAHIPKQAKDPDVAEELWEVSENITAVKFEYQAN
jgi:NAD(P)-dependent dehydrogenase (short-subunit alcohol dehydrogenase family)